MFIRFLKTIYVFLFLISSAQIFADDTRCFSIFANANIEEQSSFPQHTKKLEAFLKRQGLNYVRVGHAPYADSKIDLYGPKRKLPDIQFINPNRSPSAKIKDIHFMQGACSNTTKDGQYTVINNARDLKAKKLKPQDIPAIRVWMDAEGQIWTLDHRRFASFILAGLNGDVPVTWIPPPIVKRESYKFSTMDEGHSINIITGQGDYVVISH